MAQLPATIHGQPSRLLCGMGLCSSLCRLVVGGASSAGWTAGTVLRQQACSRLVWHSFPWCPVRGRLDVVSACIYLLRAPPALFCRLQQPGCRWRRGRGLSWVLSVMQAPCCLFPRTIIITESTCLVSACLLSCVGALGDRLVPWGAVFEQCFCASLLACWCSVCMHVLSMYMFVFMYVPEHNHSLVGGMGPMFLVFELLDHCEASLAGL